MVSWPTEWPAISMEKKPFVWEGSASEVSWIVRNKKFFFKAESCLHGMLRVPALLLCKGSGMPNCTVCFRIVNSKFVGIAHVSQYGEIATANQNTVFIEVSLIRLRKFEYDLLCSEHATLKRGRRRTPKLHICDFASNISDRAVLTHWMGHPLAANEDNPFAKRVSELLPDDLRNYCSRVAVSAKNHPFAADFQMNRRLLARNDPRFTFVDLFAGVGGFRIAMQQERGRCVFSSEIDARACATYENNFGVVPFGDITKEETKAMIPRNFDVLCAGFPCQAFSMAGLRQGFNDELQRGTLYRQVVDIAHRHQPKVIFCENVKGLLSSAGGQALKIISDEIEGAGYHVVFDKVLNSKNYGVPQNRERLYIVALRNDIYDRMQDRRLTFPSKPNAIQGKHPHTIGDVLEKGPVPKSYYLGQDYLNTLIAHRSRHADSGHSGFGYIVRNHDDIAGTLMCGGMGRERNMIHDENQKDWNPTPRMHGGLNDQHLRFLTVREWARLQGFPDYYKLPDSIQAGYRQFGNCVTVKTIRAVGRAILDLLAQCEAEDSYE